VALLGECYQVAQVLEFQFHGQIYQIYRHYKINRLD
jgi:hypothetical protein